MEELKKLRYEVLNLRNINEITTNAETKLLHKLNALKEAITVTRCSTQLKDKKITDLLNWVKSDLKQEKNNKIGKTATSYRTEKIQFLNKLLELQKL